jgi:hypothetical protein
MKKLTPSQKLSEEFLQIAKSFNTNVDLIKVLKSKTYKICEANVLIRASSEPETKRHYFFGINYITLEEISNLDNPFIAFICGSTDRTLIIPAKLLFSQLNNISHDRNGEYKINIDRNLNLVLSGRNNRLNLSDYINNWSLLLSPYTEETQSSPENSLHSIVEGRLLEIGNIRGYKTFSPDKSKKFNDKNLSDIMTLDSCPNLEFSDYNLLKYIDVLWFKERRNNLIPEYAFEVEISTGTWSGVGRMSTLIDYSNVKLYIVSNEKKKFNRVINGFHDISYRYKHIDLNLIGELYSAEINLIEIRKEIGL